MLLVKLEIWPGGEESLAEELGRIYIGNDGLGDSTVGSYTAFLTKLDVGTVWHRRHVSLPVPSQIWRTVHIKEHVRSDGPWRLVQLVLERALTRGSTARQQVMERGRPAGARYERSKAANSAIDQPPKSGRPAPRRALGSSPPASKGAKKENAGGPQSGRPTTALPTKRSPA